MPQGARSTHRKPWTAGRLGATQGQPEAEIARSKPLSTILNRNLRPGMNAGAMNSAP